MPLRRFPNKDVYEYKKAMKSTIVTTRFNNKTWTENQQFLQESTKNGTLAQKVQCLYCTSTPMGSNVPLSTNLFVLEMNNDTNQILGIGLVKHETPLYHKYQVYANDCYNTFAYRGLYRIDRIAFTEEEERLVKDLEKMCFKGRLHLKRLQGIKAFPIDMLYDYREAQKIDLVVEVAAMFKRRFMKDKPMVDQEKN